MNLNPFKKIAPAEKKPVYFNNLNKDEIFDIIKEITKTSKNQEEIASRMRGPELNYPGEPSIGSTPDGQTVLVKIYGPEGEFIQWEFKAKNDLLKEEYHELEEN